MCLHNAERCRAITLFACGLGTVALAFAALLRFPLLSTYKIQIHTLEFQTARDAVLGPALALAILIWFSCYAIGYWALLGQHSGHSIHDSEDTALAQAALSGRRIIRARWYTVVLLPPLICAALLLFIHPTTSLDVYDYLYRGHMAARYGANNFVQTPEDLRQLDRLYWYTAWRSATSAYGPLWEALSIGVAQWAGRELLGLILGFKLLSLCGWLLTALAIGLACPPAARLSALFVWLWNPLALWELVGAAHNDGWMLAAVVLAFAALRRWPLLALLLITVAALLKYAAALLWPVLLVAALAERRYASNYSSRTTANQRFSRLRPLRFTGSHIWFMLRAGLLCGALVVLAYAPWWAGPAMMQQLEDRQALFNGTPLAVFYALQVDALPEEALQNAISRFGLALLAYGVLLACIWGARRPQAVAGIGTGLWLWFMLIATPWFQPWYLSWPLALLSGVSRTHPAIQKFPATAPTPPAPLLSCGGFLVKTAQIARTPPPLPRREQGFGPPQHARAPLLPRGRRGRGMRGKDRVRTSSVKTLHLRASPLPPAGAGSRASGKVRAADVPRNGLPAHCTREDILVEHAPSGHIFSVFAALCCGALLSYPANAALRPALGWPADGAQWQALLVMLLLLPPFLVWVGAFPFAHRAQENETQHQSTVALLNPES
jgi:hypothetical protein